MCLIFIDHSLNTFRKPKKEMDFFHIYLTLEIALFMVYKFDSDVIDVDFYYTISIKYLIKIYDI